MARVSFAEDDDMIKTFPPDRTDQSFRMSILPWRSRTDDGSAPQWSDSKYGVSLRFVIYCTAETVSNLGVAAVP